MFSGSVASLQFSSFLNLSSVFMKKIFVHFDFMYSLPSSTE